MVVKIVTWNIAWWSHKAKINEAWDFLYDDIKADVALLTEMGDPVQSKCPFPYFKWKNIGENRLYWGSGIVSRHELDDCYTPPSIGALMTATLSAINLITVAGLPVFVSLDDMKTLVSITTLSIGLSAAFSANV